LLSWGYIVTCTKVLTRYHSWIHPSPHLSYISSSNRMNKTRGRKGWSIAVHGITRKRENPQIKWQWA
jgi:hypothetical protein